MDQKELRDWEAKCIQEEPPACRAGCPLSVDARAFALAPVSALAPYEYSPLLLGGILGFLIWSEVPAWTTLAGAVVVIAAGLYNLHRERLRRAAERRLPSW